MFSTIFIAADLLKRQWPLLGFADLASSAVGVGDGDFAAQGGASFNVFLDPSFNRFFNRLTPPGGRLT
jgi:hypothetical protein